MAAVAIGQFFKNLGFPVKNSRWSWGAYNTSGVVLRAWEDEIDRGGWHVRVLRPVGDHTGAIRPGLLERIDHLRLLWSGGLPGYAVIAKAVDPKASPRTIESYDSQDARAIDALVERPDGSIWAELGDRVPAKKLQQHAHRHRTAAADGPFPRAFDALQRRPGKEKPPASYVAKLPAIRAMLIDVARRRGTLTYAQARTPFGLKTFEHRNVMDRIGNDCLDAGEPILTSLIVNKDTGRCSDGFAKEFKRDDVEEREQCYEFWGDAPPGSERGTASDSLQARALRFALVAGRPEQAAFRRKVFMAYGGACVVTGCAISQALDAAHRQGRDWRQGHNSAADGLLLRKDIHSLYDAKLIRISEAGAVEFDPSAVNHYKQFVRHK